MSGSTENRTSGASDNANEQKASFTWNAAHDMLPLVRHIVSDVLVHQQRLDRMLPEKDRLDRLRRSLAWPERARRYQLQEDVLVEEQHLRETLTELDTLGVTLVDPASGQVGFPTVVNNRRAFFSWRPGEKDLLFWHFADDEARHPIPATWTEAPERRRANSRGEPRS